MRDNFAKGQIGLALMVWVVTVVEVSRGVEPFTSWLYYFAWWPLILFLDGLLLLLKGKSWLWDRPHKFLRLAGWSVSVWLVFEVFNLSLHNWRYVGLEPRLWVRWPGYALAFATVLPGIFLSAEVLEALGAWRQALGKPRNLGQWQPFFLIFGVACLILPLVSPDVAFPLIWVAFIFLLDPFCDLLGGASLTNLFAAGQWQKHLCLLTAGLFCGLWWELWNYPATSKWVYTLPVLNFGKVFEMPVLGYLGFAPFALACAVMYNFLLILDERILTPRGRRLAWLGHFAFWVMVFWAIDTWTVISFR